MTTIDNLKSETYKRNSFKFFPVGKVQGNFKTALCMWNHLKRLFSEPPQKQVLVFLCFDPQLSLF